MAEHRSHARTRTRRARTAYVVAGHCAMLVLLFGQGQARAAQALVTMTQNWDVLPEARTGILTDTTIPIERGILPGATAAMDPAPQATFEVVARQTNATPGTTWNVWLADAAGNSIAMVSIPSTATTFSVRWATFPWPSADTELAAIHAVRFTGAGGIIDIRKVTLRLVQTGTIAKTQARFPLGARTEAITASSWTDLSDGANYLYPTDYQEDGTGPYHPAFDPAPSVKLRASGTPCGLQVRLVRAIVDSNGEETGIAAVANSEIELTNAGGSVYSPSLSLVKGGVYRPQVRKVSCAGAAPTGTITSIDLELSQSSSHPDGIARTVGYYPSLSDGVDVDLTNQNVPLNFRFRAPQRNVPKATGAWAVSAKRVTGTGSYSVGLHNHTRAEQVPLSAPILDYTIGGTSQFNFQVNEVESLPAAGDELDTVVSPAAGTSVHAWSSYLQVNYRLADLDAPVLTVPFSATQTHISPGVSPGAKDSVTFSATLWDFSAIDWDVEVRNASGSLVATGSGTATAQTAAPISWTWDGRDSSGTVVADGTYTARLIATDLPGNVNDTATKTVVVDTVAPVVSSFASNVARFGPNSSPNAATFSASVNEQVAWSLSIAKGAWSSTFTGSANATSPVSKVWNAVPNGGDGTYTATLTSTDLAGNPTIKTASVIYDATGPVVTNFVRSNPAFSPNADGSKDTTTISATLTDSWTPISWTLQIKQGSTVVKTASGTGNVSFTWDGTNTAGDILADGSYTAHLTATDAGNNVRTASPLAITVDTVAPLVGGLIPEDGSITTFSQVPLLFKARDEGTSIEGSSVRFTLTNETTGGVTTFQAPSGASYNASTRWASSAWWTIQSGNDYHIEAEIKDVAGNKSLLRQTPYSQGGGFRRATESVGASQASIPRIKCQVSGTVQGGVRQVSCPNAVLLVEPSAVTLQTPRKAGLGMIRHLVPLTGATIEWAPPTVGGVPPVFTSIPAPTQSGASGWFERQVYMHYDVPKQTPMPTSFQARQRLGLELGSLVSSVPAVADQAYLVMAGQATVGELAACANPHELSGCNPSPVLGSTRVYVEPDGAPHKQSCDAIISHKQPLSVTPGQNLAISFQVDGTDFAAASLPEVTYSVGLAAPQTVPASSTGGNGYSATIPASALANGKTLDYTIEVEGTFDTVACAPLAVAHLPSIGSFHAYIGDLEDDAAWHSVLLAGYLAAVQPGNIGFDMDEICPVWFSGTDPCDYFDPPGTASIPEVHLNLPVPDPVADSCAIEFQPGDAQDYVRAYDGGYLRDGRFTTTRFDEWPAYGWNAYLVDVSAAAWPNPVDQVARVNRFSDVGWHWTSVPGDYRASIAIELELDGSHTVEAFGTGGFSLGPFNVGGDVETLARTALRLVRARFDNNNKPIPGTERDTGVLIPDADREETRAGSTGLLPSYPEISRDTSRRAFLVLDDEYIPPTTYLGYFLRAEFIAEVRTSGTAVGGAEADYYDPDDHSAEVNNLRSPSIRIVPHDC